MDEARTIAGVSCVGLYYYGARYLDPKYSRWISTDPAVSEYIPMAPINDEARRHNQNLPGMGGVFNYINGNLYHYAGNNPVRYTDPDGRALPAAVAAYWASVFVVSAAVVYVATPAGQQGLQALGEAISYGVQAANQAVANAVNAVKTKVTEKTQTQSQTILYRAVNEKELNSIKQSGGKFSMGDNSTYESGKLFQTNPVDASGYAALANKTIAKDDPYVAIVETYAPKGSYIPINSIIDAPSAVIVPKENLPLLTPAVIAPLEN